jgi:hypothetical protein
MIDKNEWLKFHGKLVNSTMLGPEWHVLKAKEGLLGVKKADTIIKEDGSIYVKRGSYSKFLGRDEI